jgi:hypothetical protein
MSCGSPGTRSAGNKAAGAGAAESRVRELLMYGSLSRTVVLQQECKEGIRSHWPAIWRQHSCSSGVRVFSGSRHAIKGDANNVTANSKSASFPVPLTSDSVAVVAYLMQSSSAFPDRLAGLCMKLNGIYIELKKGGFSEITRPLRTI